MDKQQRADNADYTHKTVYIDIRDYASRCVELWREFGRTGETLVDFSSGYYYATLAHMGGHYETMQGNRSFEFTILQFIDAVRAVA